MIKFIYFDVGGVVIKDFSSSNKWQQFKLEIGINNSNEEDFDKLWQRYADDLCIDLKVKSFTDILNQKLNLNIPEDYDMLVDGFVSRFEQNPSIWDAINTAKESTRIGLLTDMYPGMFESIKQHNLLPEIEWDVIVDSSIEKVRKPDPKIYQLAQRRVKTPPKEILFIDNDPKNIAAAKQEGWNTFLYDPRDYETSSNKLDKYLSTIIV